MKDRLQNTLRLPDRLMNRMTNRMLNKESTMTDRNRHGFTGVMVAMVAACTATAGAGDALSLSCSIDGEDMLVPAPGERFTVTVEVEGDPAELFSSVVFRLISTVPGLVIEDYRFAEPFETGSWLDGSLPGVPMLPAVWDESMLDGGSWPIETSDALFDNFLISDLASPGGLVEVDVLIPPDFPAGESLVLVAVPEEIADGFEALPCETGDLVLVDVMPSRPADLNRDGRVNAADMGLLFVHWGPQKSPPEGIRNPDLDGDGFVKGQDLGLLFVDWG